jgi:hypothetical protein
LEFVGSAGCGLLGINIHLSYAGASPLDAGLSKFRSPQAPGLDGLGRGLDVVPDDDELLSLTNRVYWGPYARVPSTVATQGCAIKARLALTPRGLQLVVSLRVAINHVRPIA